MVFVERNSRNEIVALYAMPQPGFAEEELADDHPEVVVFRNPPAHVPDRVTSRQFKMQLAILGLKTSVDGWIASQPELVQIAYENSGTFVRTEPMMAAGFAALGFTSEQVDAFFTAAAEI